MSFLEDHVFFIIIIIIVVIININNNILYASSAKTFKIFKLNFKPVSFTLLQKNIK